MLITSNCIFTLSRILGAFPFNEHGRISKFYGLYMIVSGVAVTTFSLGLRAFNTYTLIQQGRIDNLHLKQMTGISIQTTLAASCLTRVFYCFYRRRSFKFIFNSLISKKTENVHKFVLIFGVLLHIIAGYNVILFLYTPNQIYSTMTALFGSIIYMNLYSFLITMQFWVVLEYITGKLKSINSRMSKSNLLCREFGRLLFVTKVVHALHEKQLLLTTMETFGYLTAYFYYIFEAIQLLSRNTGVDRDVVLCDLICAFNVIIILLKLCTLYLITSGPEHFYQQVSTQTYTIIIIKYLING